MNILRDREPGYDGKPPKIETRWIGRGLSINTRSAPLEYMVAHGMLEGKGDVHGAGLIRASVAQRIRAAVEGSQVSGLKSVDMEPSGGGSSGGRPVSDFKLDCINELNDLQAHLKPLTYQLLVDLCFHDVWIWHGKGPKMARRKILRIHRALDYTAIFYKMTTASAYEARWKKVKQPRRPAS